ncbi:MAG: hypothetical protein AAFX08_05455 [Pseudomonadota bacterium]
MTKKVVMIGWHPSAVNYENHPGLTAEKLETSLWADEKALKALGFDAAIGFIRSAETAADDARALLSEGEFDVVLIGAGVRKDDDCFLVFEQLVNIVHECAPQAKIAFNTGPTDSAAAVQRWA